MSIILSEFEARVLISLIEKEVPTPDYYPLSLNALVNACNQKSNRDPFMNLDVETVREALHSLDQKELAGPADTFDSRVTKYEHRTQEFFNFTRAETAVFCELLVRGSQTPGELRSRAERMHHFDDLGQVQSALQLLMKREPPLVAVLPRQHGTKESRYTHLLSGDAQQIEVISQVAVAASGPPTTGERIVILENEVLRLKKELVELKAQFANFRNNLSES